MKIKAIAPWFGGKRTLAPKIVEQLGKHTQYFEPFCGSMAVLFAKEPSSHETVNNLHGDLINLARVLQIESTAFELYERAQRTLVHEQLLLDAQEYMESGEQDFSAANVDRAYWYFIACWMARNGIAGMDRIQFQIAVRWTPGGGSPTTRWQSATDSIPSWHRRLKNVIILNRDAFSIISSIADLDESAIYIDPPYYGGSRSHGEYLHDFEHDSPLFGDDHERLANMLHKFKFARIVVSYYDCQRIRELYDGWTFIDCAMNKNLHAQNGRGARKKVAPEVLIVNGPAYEVAA